jgi:hypothetical protein
MYRSEVSIARSTLPALDYLDMTGDQLLSHYAPIFPRPIMLRVGSCFRSVVPSMWAGNKDVLDATYFRAGTAFGADTAFGAGTAFSPKLKYHSHGLSVG